MEPKDFTNHSGGCQGSDLEWDKIGKKHGFVNHIHWRPEHLNNMTPQGRDEMLGCFLSAADALKRPRVFKGVELCQRNWFQAKHGNGIYAISFILAPGDKDLHGRRNESGKQVVAGGTGWAVEMGIQMEKPVFVYDMIVNTWSYWNYDEEIFTFLPPGGVPSLTTEFAGVGNRNPTLKAKQAIENVYRKTIDKISGLHFKEKLNKQS